MKNCGSCCSDDNIHPNGWQNSSIPGMKGVSSQSFSGKRWMIFPWLKPPPNVDRNYKLD
jgi:hypothetical protein